MLRRKNGIIDLDLLDFGGTCPSSGADAASTALSSSSLKRMVCFASFFSFFFLPIKTPLSITCLLMFFLVLSAVIFLLFQVNALNKKDSERTEISQPHLSLDLDKPALPKDHATENESGYCDRPRLQPNICDEYSCHGKK
ncbi:MAG: hypothetical protein EOL98_14175 [Negativicutes bacterium]|nr:hypothetical protein [Negativicutes bacterium]